ncbi:MAG TPA: DUF2188 domain-containing protein [Thermoanaerobaculia bacterium]|nr:DUF2188 domain-containing protein [Thermoanaerobaculia bacterium]
MAKRNVHTVRHGKGWANVRPGSKRASSVHRTQAAAARRGRNIARKARVEHVIHSRRGPIRASNSYGKDPHPPKG